MVDLSVLASQLQNKLNNEPNGNSYGLKFKIFPDTGEFQKAIRQENTVTEYINGELRTISSDVTTLTEGYIVATQNCKLNLIVRLEDQEYDETETFIDINSTTGELTEKTGETFIGNQTKLEQVRQALNGVFQESEVTVINGYTTTIVYSLVESGQRNQVQILGNSYSFSVYIYYIFIENGVNTQDYTFTFDGLKLPMQTVNISRTPTMDGYVPLNTKDGATKNLSTMSQFSVSITLPALSTQNGSIFDYLFNGELNVAHILTIEDKSYLVSFGENSLRGETVKNMGQTITFVECPDEYDLINIPDNLFLYEGNTVRMQGPFSLPSEDSVVFDFRTKRFSMSTYLIYPDSIILSTSKLESDYLTEI